MEAAAAPAEITPQLQAACAVLRNHLATALHAIHLFGSAVDGGLHPHSDIDLLVTVDTPLPEATRRALMLALLDVSRPYGAPPGHRPLEVTVIALAELRPWRHPARRDMQFGEWLRADLLAGRFEPPQPDPDLALLLTQVHQHGVALLGPAAAALLPPVPWQDVRQALAQTISLWHQPPDWEGDERNVVLALARIWYSACTGAIAAKDAAAGWALERLPAAHRPLVARARDAYLGRSQDDLASRPEALAAFVHHAKAAITRALQAAPEVHPRATP